MAMNDMCQTQLDLFNGLLEKQKIEKALQDIWTQKTTEMNTEIRNVENKWNSKKASREQKEWTPCVECGFSTGEGQCSQRGMNYTGNNTKDGCSQGDWYAPVWRCKYECYQRDSWYDDQRNQEVNSVRNKYNLSPTMPSITPIDFTFSCLQCTQQMALCNSEGDPNKKVQCVIDNIKQNQSCTLNVNDGTTTKTNTNNPQPTSSSTNPIPPPQQSNNLLFYLLGGGSFIFFIFMSMILLL